MSNTTFYKAQSYREKQSDITKGHWRNGLYDFRRKQIERTCAFPDCEQTFAVKPSSKKKYCSQSCAAKANNPKRSSMTALAKKEIERLYRQGLSMQEISDKTGLSPHQVSYWMQKGSTPRRSRSEAIYKRLNPNGDPFKIKTKLTKQDEFLRGLGIGLYWGEGDKSQNNTSVRLANTDPYLIKEFREFLTGICGVNKSKIKYGLITFNDADPAEAVKFWTRQLGIEENQLGKVTIIPPQGKGTYKRKSKFGVLTIIVSNKKFKERILKMVGEI